MSTGVFRQYPTPRIPAPVFTQGQPLGSPIGGQAVQQSVRAIWPTRTIPLGIAALIPAAASAYVPPAPVAVPARSAYVAQQPLPELVAPFLTQNTPDAPPPYVPVASVARPVYPTQLLEADSAALIPAAVASAYVGPASIPAVARVAYPMQMIEPGIAAIAPAPAASAYIGPSPVAVPARAPGALPQTQNEQIAPFFTQNAPDAPLPNSITTVSRAAPPVTYLLPPGLAPLVPAQVAQYVPPAAMPRIAASIRHVPVASQNVPPAAPTTYVPKWSVPLFTRQPYQVQQLRAWLIQGVAAPVIILPISGQAPMLSGTSAPTVSVAMGSVSGPGGGGVAGSGAATMAGTGSETVFG